MRILATVLIAVLFFSGCTPKAPEPCTPKIEYVKVTPPKLRILTKVATYEVTDYSTIDSVYIKVNKAQLKKASDVSRKRIKNIKFYERQNTDFNRRFGDSK